MIALKDAGVRIKDVEMFASGNLYQSNAMVGQRILQQIGQTGIPVINVSNACATGSTAFREAFMAVASGMYDVTMAVGVEQMGKQGLLGGGGGGTDPAYSDRGAARLGPDARGVRAGRHRAHAQVRHQDGALRQDLGEVASACHQESVLAVSQRSHARRRAQCAHGFVSQYALYVLPDRRRRGGGDPGLREQAEAARRRPQASARGGLRVDLRSLDRPRPRRCPT